MLNRKKHHDETLLMFTLKQNFKKTAGYQAYLAYAARQQHSVFEEFSLDEEASLCENGSLDELIANGSAFTPHPDHEYEAYDFILDTREAAAPFP